MARNFRELEQKLPPESLARARVRAKEMMADMLLAEIRKNVGLTQEDLAAQLGWVTRPEWACELALQSNQRALPRTLNFSAEEALSGFSSSAGERSI